MRISPPPRRAASATSASSTRRFTAWPGCRPTMSPPPARRRRRRIVPTGTFTDRVRPPDRPAKAAARAGLGLGPAPVALFLGSHYGPNLEAARIIADHLAPALPAIAFVVAGGVGAALDDRP